MHKPPVRTAHALSIADLVLVAATIAIAAMLFGASPGLTLVLVATAALMLDNLAPRILDRYGQP